MELYTPFYHRGYRYVYMRTEGNQCVIYDDIKGVNFKVDPSFVLNADGSKEKEEIKVNMLARRLDSIMHKFQHTIPSIKKETGLTRARLYSILNSRAPYGDTLELLADYFGVSVFQIVKWSRIDSGADSIRSISIQGKSKAIGRHPVWDTPKAVEFIKNNYQELSDTELSKEIYRKFGLEVKKYTIANGRKRLGLKKKQGVRSDVNKKLEGKEVVEFMRDNYRYETNEWLSNEIMGRFGFRVSKSAVRDKRIELGMTESRLYLTTDPEVIEIVKGNYLKMDNGKIAKLISIKTRWNASYQQVAHIMSRNKLKR